MRKPLRLLVAIAVSFAGAAHADVKIQEKGRMQLGGVAGGMLNRFAGKAASEGQVRTVAVRADRKMTLDDTMGEIVDLGAEKIYRLDPKSRTYQVVTFDELRKQAKQAQQESATEGREAESEDDGPASESDTEIDIDVKETGQTKAINGFATRQVIATVIARKKGKTLEAGGGTVFTTDTWLTRDVKGRDEVAEFDRRYFKKLYGDEAAAALGELAMVMATTPGMGAGMEKLRSEGAKMDGYPILTTTTIEHVKAPAAAVPDAEPEEEAPASARGLGGFLAKKVAKKAIAPKPGARDMVMTSTHEVLSVSTTVANADVALPEGYKEKRR